MNQDSPKRFDNWNEVDCNDCSHYWDSSCDAVSKGSKVGCNSYLATRSVVIPAKLNSLEKRFKWHLIASILVDIAFALHLLSHILGWY